MRTIEQIELNHESETIEIGYFEDEWHEDIPCEIGTFTFKEFEEGLKQIDGLEDFYDREPLSIPFAGGGEVISSIEFFLWRNFEKDCINFDSIMEQVFNLKNHE